MGRPKASEARDTRQAVLDASLDLFAENGFFGTSMREIARAVGVRESALYHYFPGKEQLLESLMAEAGTEAAGTIEAIFDESRGNDARTLLTRLAIGAMEKFSTLKHRKIWRVMMSDGLRLAAQGRFNFMQSGAGIPRNAAMRLMQRLLDAGLVRGASSEFLTMEFISPIMMWRNLLIVFPQHPSITGYRAYAQAHVDHFLGGAAPDELHTSSSKSSERSDRVPARGGGQRSGLQRAAKGAK